jgi:serine/threonine protein phosphatase PrpC
MSTEGGAASTPSNQSPVNEDVYLVSDGLGLYVVADGTSSTAAGEVAARIAVASLEEYIESHQPTGIGAILSTFPSRRAVHEAMRHAMARIIAASVSDDALRGMTAAVTMLLADHERAFVCHVGDSRLYLMREGELHQLTSDHELTVAVGSSSAEVYADAPVEVFSVDLLETDMFLLCTDGAEDVVEDRALMMRLGGLNPRAIATEIVVRARRAHPERDATVVVVRVLEDDDAGWMRVSKPLSPWAYGFSLEYAPSG